LYIHIHINKPLYVCKNVQKVITITPLIHERRRKRYVHGGTLLVLTIFPALFFLSSVWHKQTSKEGGGCKIVRQVWPEEDIATKVDRSNNNKR
jgi:hypothetical protein